MRLHFSHKIWRGPSEEPGLVKDPEMKKFHFCFSHFSKAVDGKKRLLFKFPGFSLVSTLEDREPRSRFITKKSRVALGTRMGEPKMNLPLQVLTVKILRLQGGNSIILNLGGKTKILSYVSCFYQKSLAKKKKKSPFWESASWLFCVVCFILFLSISEFSPNSCLAYIPTKIDVHHRNSKR